MRDIWLILQIPSSGKNVVAIAGDQGIIRLFDFKSKTQEAELNGFSLNNMTQ